ncbi:MAG: pyruvate kinase [bacterium]
MRRTTIIATIGPASCDGGVLEKLIRAGVDVCRLNFSHGDYRWHARVMRRVRQVSRKLDRHVAVMQDLSGPKIRVGEIEGGGVFLEKGSRVTLTTRRVTGARGVIPTTYGALPRDVKKNGKVLLDDGQIVLKALSTKADSVECSVLQGGYLKPHKGINLPGGRISAGALTRKDMEDLRFGLERGVDIVAISFVRSAGDVERVREEVRKAGADALVVAKIERPEGVRELKSILEVADGIMIARGDLGVEMAPEKVPVLQKHMIETANGRGRVVITATQMLESMVNSPRPTRAEASDVANAVFDGTDAVMLSGETAEGKYPVEAVEMMSRILREAEVKALRGGMLEAPSEYLRGAAGFSGAVAEAACRLACDAGAKAIVTFSQSGTTSMLASKYRPPCLLVGATLHENVARRMSLFWGVRAVVFKKILSTESLVAGVEEMLLKRGIAARGDVVIITSGVPIGVSGTTNMLKVHRMGERD